MSNPTTPSATSTTSPFSSARASNTLDWRLPAAGFIAFYAANCAVSIIPYLHGHERDFGAFYRAGADMLAGRDIYDPSKGRYIYPPLLAFLFQPLAYLSMPIAAVVWLILTTAALAAVALLATDELFTRLRLAPPSPNNPGLSRLTNPTFWLVALAGSLLAGKALCSEIWGGQTDVFVLLAFLLAVRWLDSRPVAAGLAVGLLSVIKYLPLAFLPYFLLRRRFTSAAAVLIGFLAGLLIPALSLGWQHNLTDIQLAFGVLNRVTGVTLGKLPSQADIGSLTWQHSVSITSAAARLADTLGFPDGPGQKAIVAIFALSVLGLVAARLLWSYRSAGLDPFRPPASDATPRYQNAIVVEWITLATLATILSPQTTSRHMILLLPVHLLVATLIFAPQPVSSRLHRIPILAVALTLMLGMILPPAQYGLQRWRDISGVSWLALAQLYLLIPVTLRTNIVTPPTE